MDKKAGVESLRSILPILGSAAMGTLLAATRDGSIPEHVVSGYMTMLAAGIKIAQLEPGIAAELLHGLHCAAALGGNEPIERAEIAVIEFATALLEVFNKPKSAAS